MEPIRIAVVGLGKIARDQHLPAIAGSSTFRLSATVSPASPGIDGVPHFTDLATLLGAGLELDAVALCTPPQVRRALAAAALAAGLHVLLEKPPGASLAEVAALADKARTARLTLFAAWHARFAAGVQPARAWLAGRRIHSGAITWREDVRVWHPGQDWIWQPGGLGVFDPGINALSIATCILPRPLFVERATLSIPADRQAPIAAQLDLRDDTGVPVTVDCDWRQTGPQTWDVVIETEAGVLRLSQGGAVLTLPDGPGTAAGADADTAGAHPGEYPALYAQFADLVRSGRRDADIAPFRLVADAFLRGERCAVAPFAA